MSPCGDDAAKQCAFFDSADAVVKLQLRRSLWNHDKTVLNSIDMNLFVTPTEIKPFLEVEGQLADKIDKNLLSYERFEIGLVPSARPDFVRQALNRNLDGPLKGRSKYVEATSYVKGFLMYDLEECLDYDDSQIDKTDPWHERHPKSSACNLRRQFFVPADHQDIYIHCNSRILFRGRFLDTACLVHSFYSPGLLQSYNIRGSALGDGTWRSIDARLRTFVGSLQSNQ